MNHVFRVVLAREHQCFPNVSLLSHVIHNVVPQFALSFQKADVTDAEKPFLSARERHANPVFCLQKTDFAFFVASDE